MAIRIEHLNYVYSEGTAFEKHALKDINLELPDGQFIGVIGHTGSGKSTLIQHLNGLLKGTSGAIYYNGKNIYEEGYDLRTLRSKVGLVFQYPEHQLFETDVFADVCCGPKTSGWSRGRSSGVQKRHWSWWVFRKNFSDSPRLSFPADKNGEWQLQVCLQWSRIFWCWMSRQQDLIRRAGTKY